MGRWAGRQRAERFAFDDGYVANAIIGACQKSAQSNQCEALLIDDWRAPAAARPVPVSARRVDGMSVVKEERRHGNKLKQILCNQETGEIVERIIDL